MDTLIKKKIDGYKKQYLRKSFELHQGISKMVWEMLKVKTM
jgi:hypothetical protein